MMSMGESVYNLIPPEQPVPVRPRMHQSRFPGKLDEKTLVYPMGVAKRAASKCTFGKPDGMSAQAPENFTRAHTGTAILPAPGPPSRVKPTLKCPTTTRTEKPLMNLHSGKNFITTNAVEAILSKPPARQAEVPYTMKKTYGKVPKYLQTNKKQVAAEKAQVAEYLRTQDSQGDTDGVAQLDPADRKQLIHHLKLKWSSVNTAYQTMTFTLDTPAKKKRKETYERQLAEIEKDIELLEKGEVVLIV
eukprot:jgi/Ulvmu1/9092/UM005_0187.1